MAAIDRNTPMNYSNMWLRFSTEDLIKKHFKSCDRGALDTKPSNMCSKKGDEGPGVDREHPLGKVPT